MAFKTALIFEILANLSSIPALLFKPDYALSFLVTGPAQITPATRTLAQWFGGKHLDSSISISQTLSNSHAPRSRSRSHTPSSPLPSVSEAWTSGRRSTRIPSSYICSTSRTRDRFRSSDGRRVLERRRCGNNFDRTTRRCGESGCAGLDERSLSVLETAFVGREKHWRREERAVARN